MCVEQGHISRALPVLWRLHAAICKAFAYMRQKSVDTAELNILCPEQMNPASAVVWMLRENQINIIIADTMLLVPLH